MLPNLSYRPYLSPSVPYAKAHSNHATAGNSLLRRLWRSVVRQWQRKKMMESLHALDDKLLRDIGICRGEIHSIVYGFDDRELGLAPVAAPTNRPLWK